jgi:cell surface protein SprA
VSIPLNASFSKSENKPKYFPDSDILVDENNVPDSIMIKSQDISFSTSLIKSSKSDNKFIKATLDKIKPSFSASQSSSSNSLNSEVLNEKYSGSVSYSYPFRRDNYFTPFKWLKDVPWLGDKLGDMNVYYSPTAFNTSVKMNETFSQTTKRVGARSENYAFGLNRQFSLDYSLTDKLKTK